MITKHKETTEERAERGLQQLSKDVYKWLNKKPSVETRGSVTYHFVSVGKIVILIVVIALIIEVLLNPQFIIDSITWTKNLFLSF